MIPGGREIDWRCNSGSSKLSTNEDATEFEGEYGSILNSGLTSPATDAIDNRSANETLDLRLLSPPVLTTTTATPPLFFMCATDEVLQKVSLDGPT